MTEHEQSYTIRESAELIAEEYGAKPASYVPQLKKFIDSGKIQTEPRESRKYQMPKPLRTYSGSPFSTHRNIRSLNTSTLEHLLPIRIPASELEKLTVRQSGPLKILVMKEDKGCNQLPQTGNSSERNRSWVLGLALQIIQNERGPRYSERGFKTAFVSLLQEQAQRTQEEPERLQDSTLQDIVKKAFEEVEKGKKINN